MLKDLASNDVVMVTRIDRLARSTLDLFAIVKQIVDTKGQFRSLAEPWADTSTSTGRLMIAVLGGLADVERDLIRTRTAEGRSRAKARGQHMGRPPKLTDVQKMETRQRRAEGAKLQELALQLQRRARDDLAVGELSANLHINRTGNALLVARLALLASFRWPIVAPITGFKRCPHDTRLYRQG
jgi:DNA invertase Pin-like site-specific DNA recombinase